MAKRKAAKASWIVRMRVERNVTVYVEARDEDEAKTKASEWDIEGDEEPGDTINQVVLGAELNE